nr:integrase, catalytic region, zinc finger, CCHC-type, peptidase aspartic, catalytic [Tanacetum cinerariifolium]
MTTVLRFVLLVAAFCSYILVSAIWFCVFLIEDISCVLPRRDSAISKHDCILSQDFLRFISRLPAFCLTTSCVLSQDFLHFVSRHPAFCLKASCVLPRRDSAISKHDCILSQDFLHFVSRHPALYCRGKENGVNILKSIDEGPFQMGTVREPLAEGTEGAPHLGPERPRVYSDLSPEEKDRYNAGIRETNILLQGLPKDIYTLINHYIDAKDIWDNMKMLLEGSELTKEDQESQIGLRDSNYDQLYAYLKQHEAHANENKMMLDRFTQHTMDPLALMSNVSHQQYYSQSTSTPLSTYVPPHLADNAHLDLGLSLTDMCLNTHIFDPKQIRLKRDKSEQNRIKTGQKREAW